MRRTLQRVSFASNATHHATTQAAFVCSQCRLQASRSKANRLDPVQSFRRHASSRLPIDPDKWRKKIWGTDNPPGPKDPYTQRHQDDPAEVPAAVSPESSKSPESVPEERADPSDAVVEPISPQEQYEPAKTWDGLDRIGGAFGWWEEAWDQQNQFQGFLPTMRIADVAVEGAVKRALIEILVLREAGRPLSDSINALVHTTFDYNQVTVDNAQGRPILMFEDEGIRSELLESMSTNDDAAEGSENATGALNYGTLHFVRAEQNATDIKSDAPAWYGISLDDDDGQFKFAILKRVMQLTGARIPDPSIQSTNSIASLIQQLMTKPRPKKLADILLSRADLMALPNVEIFEQRRTPIDKEKEVGRWKVIEKELGDRDLPLTGHAHKERRA